MMLRAVLPVLKVSGLVVMIPGRVSWISDEQCQYVSFLTTFLTILVKNPIGTELDGV